MDINNQPLTDAFTGAVSGVILIVDDEARNRKLFSDLLMLYGHTVIEAENGEYALAIIAETTPDVILLDVMMPGIDGFEVCRQIKNNPATGHIPVLLVTALNQRSDRMRGIEAGADEFLSKPVDREEILLRVRNALVTRRLRDQVARDAALVASEAHFRGLIENSNDIIFLVDAGGSIQYASPSYQRLTGSPVHSVLSQSLFDLFEPDDVPGIQAVWQRILDTPGGSSDIKVARMHHADGSWRLYEGVGKNLLNDPAIGAIVVNTRDVTERKQREDELATISIVSSALRSATTRTEMLPVILDQVTAIFNADGAALALVDAASEELVFELTSGELASGTYDRLPAGAGVAGRVIATGQVYASNDIQNDPLFVRRDLLGYIRALACIPLMAQGKTIGVLMMGRAAEIIPAELRLLTSIADISANAIYRASLHEQTQRRLEQITALREVDIAISSSMDLRITFLVVLTQLLEQLRGSAADILLLNPSMHTLAYCQGQGFRSTTIERFHCRVGEGFAGRAASLRQAITVDNLSTAGAAFNHPEMLAGEGFVAYQAAPLVSKGVVKGVLEMYHRTPFKPGPEWDDFLEAVTRQAAIAIDNSELYQGLQRSNQELALAYDATIEGWSHALDLRDKETEGHTLRVAELTGRLAREMGAGEVELVHIRRGALLHDIGKMAVPDAILLKPGKLTADECALMRKHPQTAYEMLAPITYLRLALDIPYAHHERWDGSGYPRGLKGEQIPLAARIFAVIDVWDAIISERPYHPAQSEASALEYIRSSAGAHFDPRVVEAFLNLER